MNSCLSSFHASIIRRCGYSLFFLLGGFSASASAQVSFDKYYPPSLWVVPPYFSLNFISGDGRMSAVREGLVPTPAVIRLPFQTVEGEGRGPCGWLDLPDKLTLGLVVESVSEWVVNRPCPEDTSVYIPGMPLPPEGKHWTFIDRFTFNAPVRRKTWDGAEFEASPLVKTRNGHPWVTTYWAYNIGLAESQFDWDAATLSSQPEFADWPGFADRSQEFMLAELPPPMTDGRVTEYVNAKDFPAQPGGQYFYTSSREDMSLLDSLPNWSKTGKSFNSGGFVTVCRLYGGNNGGPNTHFYSASADECAALKEWSIFSYEGQVFSANMPLPPKNEAQQTLGALRDCPQGSIPLYRVYNNASASAGRFVSNHRYFIERSDVEAAVANGWVDEGHVMCVAKDGGVYEVLP